MTNINNVQRIEQIKQKLKVGDYIILGEMLGCSYIAARQRFLRGDKEAADALEKMLQHRQQLIQEYQSQKQEL